MRTERNATPVFLRALSLAGRVLLLGVLALVLLVNVLPPLLTGRGSIEMLMPLALALGFAASLNNTNLTEASKTRYVHWLNPRGSGPNGTRPENQSYPDDEWEEAEDAEA